MATRPYGAFLLRCWGLGDGSRRIEVIHVQSGDRTVMPSLRDAAAWIEARAGPAAARDAREPRRAAIDADGAIDTGEKGGPSA